MEQDNEEDWLSLLEFEPMPEIPESDEIDLELLYILKQEERWEWGN